MLLYLYPVIQHTKGFGRPTLRIFGIYSIYGGVSVQIAIKKVSLKQQLFRVVISKLNE